MSRFQLAVCTCLALAFTATGLAAGEAPAPITVASPWVDLHKARVRLIGGARRSKSYVAGVEITLADGWKTYWRNPGDAGVPPVFDWLGSTNVGLVKVLYPAPARIAEPAAETIGYEHAVLFPVEVTPKDPTKPVELKLLLEFGICREICIPAQSILSLTIPTAALASQDLPAEILAALSRVPRPQAERRRDDPELQGMSSQLEGPKPRLRFTVRFPRGGKDGDLFIEAPEGLYVPLPKRLADTADGTANFEVDLSRADIARDLKGKTLTLTLVSEVGATEALRVVE
jgi:DsbC/DsbD-like thiol-disulfide interchange protein